MKVRIPSFTIDIDPAVWDANYHTGTDPDAIRADVRSYVLNGVVDGINSALGDDDAAQLVRTGK